MDERNICVTSLRGDWLLYVDGNDWMMNEWESLRERKREQLLLNETMRKQLLYSKHTATLLYVSQINWHYYYTFLIYDFLYTHSLIFSSHLYMIYYMIQTVRLPCMYADRTVQLYFQHTYRSMRKVNDDELITHTWHIAPPMPHCGTL